MNTIPQGFELKQKVSELQAQLLEAHPKMPDLLRIIHSQLKADPENVTLLSEEEIHVIVEAQEKITQTKVVADIVAGKKSGKSVKKITLADL